MLGRRVCIGLAQEAATAQATKLSCRRCGLTGVIAAESETQTVTVPADPAIPGSAEATVSQVRPLQNEFLTFDVPTAEVK